MIGSSALMRQAVVQALHHTQHRKAFGKLLIEQPLMQNVLADLALESEACTALTMRVARAVDASPRNASEAAFARIATAIGKYWVCKRCPPLVNEAQEVPRRYGLCRREQSAAPVPPGAAEFDLGRQRQHPVPGCAARLVEEPGNPRGAVRANC